MVMSKYNCLFIIFILSTFLSNTAYACIPSLDYKNLYSINISIDKTYFKNGDWYNFYEGKLYSNYDYKDNPTLHTEILEYQKEEVVNMTISPNHISFYVDASKDCKGYDKYLCNNLVVDELKKLQTAGLIDIINDEISEIKSVASAQTIITKVGYFKYSLLETPPSHWVSYYDSNCFDLDHASPQLVIAGSVIMGPYFTYISIVLTILVFFLFARLVLKWGIKKT